MTETAPERGLQPQLPEPCEEPPVLAVCGLSATFPGGVRAVSDLSFEVRPGEVLGLVGESGSGKTVTALAVMGLLPRHARVRGSIRLHGSELLGLPERQLARVRGKDIAMVFQDPQSAFTPVYTITDQLAEAVRVHDPVSRAAARRRAAELLDLVGIPAARARAFPHEFSGGMLQRAMIAMATAHRPAMIIADEPTTALDVTVQAQVLEVLALARRETGAALLLVTHDLGVVAATADRVTVVRAGELVESAAVDDLFHRPRHPYTITLLAATPRLDALHPPPPREGAPRSTGGGTRPRGVVLEVAGLGVTHANGVRAVDGVTFDVRKRETLALVGESGCGKTSALMAILSLEPAAEGRVSVLGGDVRTLTRAQRRALRRDLQIVFQDPLAALDPRMPVAELLAEPLRAHGAQDRRRREARVRELLGLVGLAPGYAARYPWQLSGGQRQRVGIARALALEPRLLVLDEPVSALDVSVRAGILRLLAELKARLDLSLLVVAHDLAMVRGLADRVAVMYSGRIVELGDVARIYQDPGHPYTRALLAAVPVPDPRLARDERRTPLSGEPPSGEPPSGEPPSREPLSGEPFRGEPAGAGVVPGGCCFRARCPLYSLLDEERRRRCVAESPTLRPRPGGDLVACHHSTVAPRPST